MKRLILIEGLPGTGKTTISTWLSGVLDSYGEKTTLLCEGDENIPCDFYLTCGIPINEFELLLAHIPSEREKLLETALLTGSYAYLRLDKCPDHISDIIKRWDMGDESNQNITVADYIPCALERLGSWVDSHIGSDETVIIDSGYLQNPINELLFRHGADDEVRAFVGAITDMLNPLNPVCIYLRRDSAEQAIAFAKMAKGKDWAERVDELLRQSGCKELFSRRFDLEIETLQNIEHLICHIFDDNWEDAKKRIENYFAQKNLF